MGGTSMPYAKKRIRNTPTRRFPRQKNKAMMFYKANLYGKVQYGKVQLAQRCFAR
jgi:hypothetical protein